MKNGKMHENTTLGENQSDPFFATRLPSTLILS